MHSQKISHHSVCGIALLAAALIWAVIPQASAVPLQAQGLVVVSDGSTNRSYAPAYEYTSLRYGDGSFGLTLVDGKKVAGLAKHVVANYEYGTRTSVAAVAAMEVLTQDHVKTMPYLSPRILRMKEELRKMEFEAGIAGQPIRKPTGILAAEMTFKGRTFRNIRATASQEARLFAEILLALGFGVDRMASQEARLFAAFWAGPNRISQEARLFAVKLQFVLPRVDSGSRVPLHYPWLDSGRISQSDQNTWLGWSVMRNCRDAK